MIVAGAFAKTITERREVGRRVPLHWGHHADQIVGDIDPEEMWEMPDEGLEVSGRNDLDDEQGRTVWKSLNPSRLGFQLWLCGQRVSRARGRWSDLLELDVFEVSATPSPMNNRTRVLSTKSVDERRYELSDGRVVSYDEMLDHTTARHRAEKAARPIEIVSFDLG